MSRFEWERFKASAVLLLVLGVAACSGDPADPGTSSSLPPDFECTGQTDVGGCNIIEQTGCEPEQACQYVLAPGAHGCNWFEGCVNADSFGDVPPGGPCDEFTEVCRPDSFCLNDEGVSLCHELCCKDEDCTPEGWVCSRVLDRTIDNPMVAECDGMTITYPAAVCMPTP